jgi:formamidopyrimidine-DNA glycosylase
MPELPEVETIKNELSPSVVGQSLTEVTVLDARLVSGCPAEELRRGVIGQKIESLGRRGKYLIFHLSNGNTRAIFHLSNGHCFLFRDPRRLGVIWLVDDADAVVGKLGPDALGDNFTPDVLGRRLSRRCTPVKAALLDQGNVAGIGNMYADEALFAARIHPLRRAEDLSAEEVQTLHNCICQVLGAGIGSKGASVRSYIRPDGELGTAQLDFNVAHRGGQPCPVCGSTIERCVVQNRGTYFCPRCQPLACERST